MIIVKANKNDIDEVLEITVEQRQKLKEAGIPQWQGEYPSKETFTEDVKLERLYVGRHDNHVVSFFALVYPDHNYDYIEDGKWLDNSEYIAIHRMAVKEDYKGRGYSSEMFRWVKDHFNHIRVDTHKVNEVMNRSLIKNGFKYTGVVYMEDKTPRNAYEWIKK